MERSVVCKCVDVHLLLFFSEKFLDFHFFQSQQTKLLQQAALFSTACCVIGGAFEISKLEMGLAASNLNICGPPIRREGTIGCHDKEKGKFLFFFSRGHSLANFI